MRMYVHAGRKLPVPEAHMISEYKVKLRVKAEDLGLDDLGAARLAYLTGPRFDAALRTAGVRRILAIGDCHGGKALGLFSTLVRSHFEGGSMYSWVHGKRSLPPVESVLVKSDRRGPGVVVIAFSYGEIDCRCHARTEALAAPDAQRQA